jgi:hypothetical protein
MPRQPVMDGSTKIAISVVAAAFVLVLGFVGYREFERQREQEEALRVLSSMAAMGQRTAEQYQAGLAQVQIDQQERFREQSRQAAADRLRYALADNQRCVGGVVVQVDGSRYTQLGSIQYPIHCDGYFADRPLR